MTLETSPGQTRSSAAAGPGEADGEVLRHCTDPCYACLSHCGGGCSVSSTRAALRAEVFHSFKNVIVKLKVQIQISTNSHKSFISKTCGGHYIRPQESFQS